MSSYKMGDILVSLKDQKSSSRDAPTEIREGFIGENISLSDEKVVWFRGTPPAGGCYNSKNFRLATEDEKAQYAKGKKIVEPECPFEEGDIVTTTDIVETVKESDIPWTLPEGLVLKIDGIVKTKDITKSIMYFEDIDGYYNVTGSFRLANNEEVMIFENTRNG